MSEGSFLYSTLCIKIMNKIIKFIVLLSGHTHGQKLSKGFDM